VPKHPENQGDLEISPKGAEVSRLKQIPLSLQQAFPKMAEGLPIDSRGV